MRRKSLKQIAKAKARAELREVKERIKSFKSPFSKIMGLIDKLPKIIDVGVNLGLAVASFNAFGKTQRVVTEEVKVPVFTTVAVPTSAAYSWLDPNVPLPSAYWDMGLLSPTYRRTTTPRYVTETRTKVVTDYNPFALLIEPVGYKLARSENLIAGAVGVGILGAIGATAVVTPANASKLAEQVVSGELLGNILRAGPLGVFTGGTTLADVLAAPKSP